MKAFSVPEVKPFMAGLLQGQLFHGWQLRGAALGLISRIEIEGNVNSDYLTDEEKKTRTSPYLLWEEIQPKIRGLIQGGHTPSSLNIILAVSPERVPDIAAPFVDSFLLNIRFEAGKLTLVTGLSTNTFSMDKTPEHLWDEKIPVYMKAHQILLTEA